MLWTWKKLFRQKMERRDWKAYPNCLKPRPLTHSKSWLFKWGHVYKMVASIDISSPGKWFSIYKTTDAIAWRLKMTVITILFNQEKGKPRFNKNYHPYKRPPCMYLEVPIYQHEAKMKNPHAALWHCLRRAMSNCHFQGTWELFLKQPGSLQWQYSRCSYSTLNSFKT